MSDTVVSLIYTLNAPFFLSQVCMTDSILNATDIACLNCVLKHLSQAMIIHEEEVPMGYPEHIYRVFGHLAEASRESVKDYPDLADAIRSHRLALMDDRKHVIPYQGLLDYTDLLLTCLDQNTELPGVPDNLIVHDAPLETHIQPGT